ncbi:MAG: chemotaxis protein CheA, partial [Spirochaetales bacterium]|nr:chemotaxis protein CheA [Spirochaetales bacterium]
MYFIASADEVTNIENAATISDVTLSITVSPVDFAAEESILSDDNSHQSEEDVVESEVVPESLPDTPSVEKGSNGKKTGKSAAAAASGTGGSLLRVDSKRIDTLLNLVSEAVINKASFNQLSQVFADTEEELVRADTVFRGRLNEVFESIPALVQDAEKGDSASALKNGLIQNYSDLFDSFKSISVQFKSSYNQFRNTAQNLGRITGELQEGVMQIRMVPISQIFSRFPRLVRDVSKSLSKQVALELEGEDTELDKSVIEDLLDPLIHCVRNAVDHGIEIPAERESAGKSGTGTIYLKAANEGNLISIEISDDGKGINVEAVHKKAVSKGIIHPSKQLSDIEAYNLIFEPGFSTAAKVSDISGRGVGLDVVKKQIEKLNGSVSVWSEEGNGTKITIKLPLTL